MAVDISTIKSAPKAKKQKKGSSFSDLLNKDISFSKGVSDKKKQEFYMQLSMLLKGGVDTRTALEIISEGEKKRKQAELLKGITSEVVQGKTFSKALKDNGKFSEYETYSLLIGEETGRLPEIMQELAEFYAKKIKQKQQVIKALSYPFFVLFTSFAVLFIMIRFIVPMFKDVYARFDKDLPAITEFILTVSESFGTLVLPFILFIAGVGIFIITQRRKSWFRKYQSRILLRIPFFGNMLSQVYLIRFCSSMHMLTSCRIPLLQALGLIRQMIRFYPVEQALQEVENDIMAGKPLHQALTKHKIFPYRMITLIKVGEQVNKLDDFFSKIAEQYSDEVDHKSAIMGNVLEPLIIIFLGGIVGFILIAMYLPIFQLSTAF